MPHYGRWEEKGLTGRGAWRAAGGGRRAADKPGIIGPCVRCLCTDDAFPRYEQALKAGRLDISGARWGLDDAEAVLKLRARHLEACRRHHVAPERHRLYPSGQDRVMLHEK